MRLRPEFVENVAVPLIGAGFLALFIAGWWP